MSDQTQANIDFLEKMWKIVNLQADTALKQAQVRTEVWKVVIAAAAAGGALVAASVAITRALS